MAESTHQRRTHVRRNANDTVSDVSEATVRNRGHKPAPTVDAPPRDALLSLTEPADEPLSLDDADVLLKLEAFFDTGSDLLRHSDGEFPMGEREKALLLSMRDLLNRVDFGYESDTEVDDIVYALEHPEWSSRGFNRAASRPWLAIGATPDDAAAWTAAGFNFDEAFPWHERGLGPAHATLYQDAGIDPSTGHLWTVSRGIPADDAIKWIADGLDPDTVRRLLNVHRVADHATYREWVALGVTDPEAIEKLTRLGHERIAAWTDLGVPLDEIPEMSRWTVFKQYGYSERDLAVMAMSGYRSTYLIDWAEERIPADQIVEFIEKGYTPKRAAKKIANGVTATAAEDLRRGEPVPGKAWTTIKESLDGKVAANGYEVEVTHSRSDHGFVHVDVALYRGGDRAGYPIDTYRLSFSSTGRFMFGSAAYQSKVATVDAFLRDYLNSD
jgi:hypothetical protein